jgi:hypothetical protein
MVFIQDLKGFKFLHCTVRAIILHSDFHCGDFFHEVFAEALEDYVRVAVSALVLKFTRSIPPP